MRLGPIRLTCLMLLMIGSLVRGSLVYAEESAASILAKSREVYASLQSYADSGTVTLDTTLPGGSGASTTETHSFNTSFEKPRSFLFDLKKVHGERVAVWCDGADFQSWWSVTGVHDIYPKGKGLNAFALTSHATRGAVVQIAALLFPGAGLQGPILSIVEPAYIGTEQIGGIDLHRIEGKVGLAYGKTGAVTSTRKTTVWIDKQSLLVRRIVEDTPDNAPKGSVDRITTTFDPKLNPQIDPSTFRFLVP